MSESPRTTENLIVERNGILAFCGNTDEVYGHVGEGASHGGGPPQAPQSVRRAARPGATCWPSPTTPTSASRCWSPGANTIGPYQYPEKATPLFVTNALDDQPLPVYGDGTARRHYLYVDDHAVGDRPRPAAGDAGEAYNVGTPDEVDTVQLATRILDLLGKPHSLIRFVPDRPAHDYRYSLDSPKLEAAGLARRAADWETTIETTVRWYAEHQDWWRPLKSGAYLEYYKRQYGAALAGA